MTTTTQKIPLGYKQTELGIIPEDWDIKKLGEAFAITAGGDLDVNHFSLIQDERYCYPIYSNALTNKGLYGFASESKQLENTITVTARGQVGVAYPRNHKYCAIGRVLMLNPKAKLNINFVSEYINNYVGFSNESTGVPQLTAPQISKHEIVFPPEPEQTAIATVLSDTDVLIEHLEKLIAKKRAIKQGTMQQLLTGKKRLPGFEKKKGYKQTELGLMPEDWDIAVFENIADKSKKWSITGGPFGSNLKASDYTDDGVQIVQLQNIGDGYFIDDYQIFTSEEKANELVSCNIYPNEIILSKMGDPVARACFMPDKAKRYLMASDGIRLVVDEKEFFKKFIHEYINSIYFRKRAFEISTGTTRLRIGLPDLKGLLVIKPLKAEQTAIATILSDMDAEIERLEQKRDKYTMLKQGMMQQLLTGKIRIYANN